MAVMATVMTVETCKECGDHDGEKKQHDKKKVSTHHHYHHQ
jgi:hypothetical protein